MYNKAVYQIVSVVLALVLILGNPNPTQAAPPVADPLLQTSGPTIYWGAMVEAKAPSITNLQGVMNTFESRAQKKMSIIHWGQPWMQSDGSWSEFQTVHFDNVRNHGSIPMINWTSWRLGSGANQPDFQLRDVYEGKYDAYITRWAAGGSSTTLYVDTSPVQTTFLKFDLTPLAGKTISSVTLRFKITGDAGAGSTNGATVKFVSDVNWKEAYMSFNNTVPISGTVLGTIPSNTALNTSYDVTLSPSLIQPNAGRLLSIAIVATGSDELIFYSRESANVPQLIIKY